MKWVMGHATSRKELRWLSSVFAGVLMCKIVFDLTGAISTLSVKRYNKLNDKEKLEWNNRGFSTFHAIAVSASVLYLCLVSNVFADDPNTLLIYRSSVLSDAVLGVSVGYFLTDLAMILYQYPALGGVEYIVHHCLSLYSLLMTLVSGEAQFYILMVLLTEFTTPFVNLRWYLDVAGLKNSKLYIVNGVALFFGWLVARIIMMLYFFYHLYIHFNEARKVFPLGFYSLITVPSILFMMNIFWFWKIARGMVKTLQNTRKIE